MNEYEKNHEQFKKVLEEAEKLRWSKFCDYGFSYKSFGALGIIVQMNNKMSRMKVLINKPKANNESLRDSAIDLLNYSAMLVMELDSEQGIR